MINRIEWMQRSFPLSSRDVILHKTPSTFDVSVWEIFWWSFIGCRVALLPPNEEANPETIIRIIELNSVTVVHFVPSMLNAFLDYVKSTSAISRLKSLKRVFSSGEALNVNQVLKFYDLFDNAELVNLYGPTEATIDVTWHVTKTGENPVPLGKPIDNTRLYILDTSYNRRPIGMFGELGIAGVGVSEGYINDIQHTSERFISIPSLNEEIIYLTGDLARIRHDNTIEYLGRNDRQVKIRGFRIELGEIESVITQQKYVSDATVITNIEADEISHLYSYVILNDKSIKPTKIIEDIEKILPKYMLPDKVIIINEFPLTSNGKINKSELLKLNWGREAEKIPPFSEEEKIIAGIWEDVLGVKEMGINENFFELGGNSINFVSVLALANEKGLKFTFQQLFKNPTISDLLKNNEAPIVEEDMSHEFTKFELLAAEDKLLIPDQIEDAYPMSMLQAGLVYQSTIMEGSNNYHDIVSYLIKGKIDIEAFSKAVKLLVDTQPIFRTSYNMNDYSEYLQLVQKDVEKLPLNIYDLSDLNSNNAKEEMYEQWFWKEEHRHFNWRSPGLVQFHIHIYSDNLYKYSISQHNSVLDGWSMNQIHTFLFNTYFDFLNGKNTFSKELSGNNHNRTFIYLEQKAINSPQYSEFSKRLLIDVPDGMIPRSRLTKVEKGNEVIFQDVILPMGLSDKLLLLANELKIPVKDILLTSHVKFLSLLTNNTDIFMGYEIGGRPELLGVENALGVFLNTMPFRVNIKERYSWKDLILTVYETEAAVLPYRRYPMAKVKQDMGRLDILFETVFNFTHFYSLKNLRDLPGFEMIDVRAAAITEFPLRIEYSRHFYSDKIELSLHYHTSQYDKEDITFFGEIFINILNNMVDNTYENHYNMNKEEQLRKYKFYNDNNKEIGNSNKMELEVSEVHSDDFLVAVDKVKNIWSNTLKIAKDEINLQDDFFQIGGNSLSALKVSLLLQNETTLKTIMQKSILAELAGEIMNVNSQLKQSTNILECLSKTTSAPINIVFLPYAGGNAINFMPIAEEFEKNNINISVYAAELPGHDPNLEEEYLDFSQLSSTIAKEIEVKLKGKQYMIWGHCVGTALALDITHKLESKGFPPIKLFLAAKTINNPKQSLEIIENVKKLIFSDIVTLYSQWSGNDEFSCLGQEYEKKLIKSFKQDSIESNKYMHSLWNQIGTFHVMTPTAVLITKDDFATENYEEEWKVWAQWAPNIELKVFDNGGHYFLRTIQAEVVSYILEELSIK